MVVESGTVDANWVAAIAAIVAVLVALAAWRTSDHTLRTSFRPIVRPVPVRNVDHPLGLHPRALLLKNYGRGPAFSVLLYRDDAVFLNAPPMAERDIVEPLGEPLGPIPQESTRIGRLEMKFHAAAPDLELGRRYRLIYQDLAGRIHETQLTIERGHFRVQFMPPRALLREHEAIPASAYDRFQVVTFEPPDA